MGLGGAFFAALAAITALAKEEKEHTAEFLITHPVSRSYIVTQKLFAVLLQIVIMNGIVLICAIVSILAIGEEMPTKELLLLHLAYFLLQLEIAGICFGISAFLRRGGMGIGMGIAAMGYFLNIIANISENAEWLKYLTPFGYTEGADIVSNGSLDGKLVLVGMIFGLLGIVVAYWKYCRKDIQ